MLVISKKVALSIVGAAAVALAFWLTHNESEVSISDTPLTLKEAPATSVNDQKAVIGPTTAEPIKTAASKTAPESDLGHGMVDPNPLAFITRQHALAKPGSFANAEQVTYRCRQANQSAGRASVEKAFQRATSLGKDAASFQARFLEAQQIIQSRCNDFRQEVATDNPLKSDKFAAEFVEARSGSLNPDKNYIDNLIVLAQQGQLASAYVTLATTWKFQGEEFKSEDEKIIFNNAVQLAAFNSTSVEGSRDKDLRTLSGCVSTGICDGTYDSLLLYRWPEGSPQREKVLTLAKRMEAVFRANDIQGWVKKP